MISLTISRARRFVAGCGSSSGRRALRRGVLPSSVHRPMLRRVQPDLVIDVGANRGQFTLDVLQVRPSVHIYAFEPLSAEADVYEELFAQSLNVHLDRRGAWSSSGRVEMHQSASADSSSMLPITDLQATVFPGTSESRRVWVDVVRLDVALSTVAMDGRSLLKVDVQGGELEVLRGAGDLLHSLGWVYAELSLEEFYRGQPLASEVITFLRDHDFDLVDTGPMLRHGGRTVQFDALFERRGTQGSR